MCALCRTHDKFIGGCAHLYQVRKIVSAIWLRLFHIMQIVPFCISIRSTTDTNGRLFLPAAGYRNGTDLNNVGSNGNYWSRSLNESNPNNARYLNFNSSNVDWNNNNRNNGHTVRPVRCSPCLVNQQGAFFYS